MDSDEKNLDPCPIAHGLSFVGDAWSILILRDAALGMTRYDQLRRSLGIAPNILASRLKALTAAGLLEKRQYSARPPRDEYLLTDAGRDFLPVLHVIGEWARKHHGDRPLSHAIDATTGDRVHPLVIDAASGVPIGSRPLRLVQPNESVSAAS